MFDVHVRNASCLNLLKAIPNHVSGVFDATTIGVYSTCPCSLCWSRGRGFFGVQAGLVLVLVSCHVLVRLKTSPMAQESANTSRTIPCAYHVCMIVHPPHTGAVLRSNFRNIVTEMTYVSCDMNHAT